MGDVGFCFFAVAVGTTSSHAAPAMENNPIKWRCALMRAMFLSRRSSYYSDFFRSWILLIGGALSLPKAMIILMQWPDRSTAKRQGVDGEEAGGFLGTPQPIKLLPMSRIESSPTPRLIEPSPMPRLIKLLPMPRQIEPFPMPQLIEMLPTPPLIDTSPMPWLIELPPTPWLIKSLPMPRLIKLPSIALPHESMPTPRSFPMPPMLWLLVFVANADVAGGLVDARADHHISVKLKL